MKTEKIIAAGVLPICSKTGRILLIRRGFDQDGPGLWASFGGKMEADEDQSPKETAKREFAEESLFSGHYKISKTPLHVYSTNMLTFYLYVGVFEEEFTPDLEKANEAIDYGWFYLDETPSDKLPGFEISLKEKYDMLKRIICFYSQNC